MFPFDRSPDAFIWAGGIEDTFIPQVRPGYRALDEYELIGHYDHWREDLALARNLGLQALRWGVPWYRVEPRPGAFDWRWTDEVIPYLVNDLGITPIVDLMHYGCPLWLERTFFHPDYPRRVAAYAAAFTERYRGLTRVYTPLNEPHMNALMCGQRGVWPPYARGERGYIRVMLALARGILRTVAAIKQIQPDAVMVHVEATGLRVAGHDALKTVAEEDTLRRYLCYDLLTGRVTPGHPLFSWLLWNGVSVHDLEEIAGQAIALDVMGMNFYPQWSTTQLYLNRKGRLAYRSVEPDGTGFGRLIEQHYQRYGVPIMITETSAHGDDAVRLRWLQSSLAAVKHLRQSGVPVLGYTWFPLTTMIDWRYRYGTRPPLDYRIDLGLYRLDAEGQRPWQPTPLAEQLRASIRNSEEAVGILAHPQPDGVLL